ncbi:MAG: MFS transporter [Phenylobacterium sp.]|uniref:MFS transporter n=1 Tax=Phenylobacterium sp. TaxID=1871053 RepID=UPI001A5728FB|nr:MFS transporter [Phenylobacterium sp.]MBL8772326.1 MFS transporter [Phenylobacterium sp.]
MNSSGATARNAAGFPAYLFAHGAWFLAFGVQMVIFPYLVRVVLQENEVRFGVAQMCLQLPTTLLILLGGFVADRADGRRIVVAACVAATVTFLGLGLAVAAGRLTYGLMIAYALIVGVIGAFATPARDALLSHVAPDPANIQRAVSGAFLAQFVGQILGMLLAMATPIIGVTALLLGQAGLLGLAGVAATRMRPRASGERPPREGHPFRFLGRQIAEGFAAVLASPVIAPVLLLSIGMGVCFFGAFSVLLPLIVQGYFPDTADGRANPAIATALGAFTLCFWVGSTVSAVLLMRRGAPRRKGAAYLAALASGALVLLACALPMPLWTLCALNFAWGLGGGVAMTLGRGFVQEHAPPETRARVLSIFTLGQMGGAPVGAVVYGVLAHAVGPRLAIVAPALLMGAIVAAVAARSRLLQLRS